MKCITISITEQEHNLLKIKSQETGLGVSELTRRAIDGFYGQSTIIEKQENKNV